MTDPARARGTPDRGNRPARAGNSAARPDAVAEIVPRRPRGHRLRRLGPALCGLAICASLPPWGWWPLGMVGLAGWSALIARTAAAPRPGRARFRIGVGVGLGWFIPSFVWMITFTPPGLVVAVVVFSAMLGVASLSVPPGPSRWVALPAALTLSEWVRWHAPFGGVPLAMTAMGQARGPLLPLARVGGPLLITLAVGLLGTALEAALRRSVRPAALLAAPAIIGTLVSVWAPQGKVTGHLTVAAVQGGGVQGTVALDTSAVAVFDRHLAASETITTPVDLVLWPENVINVAGRLADHPWNDRLSAEARRLGAPLLVGAVEDVDERHFANLVQVYEADGSLGDRYDKVRRVPFGEYVPLRAMIEPFGGRLLPHRDQVPGTDRAVVSAGRVRAAVAVSWEIFFPRRARDGVLEGAEVLVNPTNGSSYWLTIVQSQQIASSSLRATETGRWTIQAAPTGFSAVIDPSGRVRQRTGVSETKVLIDRIETRSGRTIAVATADAIPVAAAAALLAGGWAFPRRRRSREGAPVDPDLNPPGTPSTRPDPDRSGDSPPPEPEPPREPAPPPEPEPDEPAPPPGFRSSG